MNHANMPAEEYRRPERFWTQPASYNAEHHDLSNWTAVIDADAGKAVAYFANAHEAIVFAGRNSADV